MRFLAWIAFPLAALGADLDTLARAVRAEVRPDEAMQYVREIYSRDRYFTFPKFLDTAAWVRRTMEANGMRAVEVVEAPADGESRFGFWTMPLAWDVKAATLEVVSPSPLPLADYSKTPASLCMWSGPTPAGGLTAEVAEYARGADLKGKFVLTSQNAGGLKWELVKSGAAGAINAFTENANLKDGRQWVNSWGDYGWPYTKTSTSLPCFSISPRETEQLRALMKHGPVRVRAKVESRTYAGVYPYTTGLLRGEGSDEEVLTLGHTAEQGANDNATGVAAMLEAGAALHRLIESGSLPRPKRSIRILAMPELFGSSHYIASNPDRIRRTVAAMCVDTPAAAYNLAGTEYTFYRNPRSGWSYVDSFILQVAAKVLGPRPFHFKPYMTGTDNYIGEPSIGIPAAWPYSGTGVHTHHNSADTPETVDERSLRDLAALDAVFLYYLASAGETEARWLAEVALTHGLEQVARSIEPPIAKDRAADAIARVRFAAACEKQAVRSAARLAPSIRESLAPLEAQIDRLAADQESRARRLAGSAEAAPRRPNPVAEKIVVVRKRFGSIPLDDLAPDEREGYPSAAWATVPLTALYWCDGRRTLADVIRRTELELGPSRFDFVGYFRFLRKRGYVDFRE